jgi:RNA:NAD 2'-phosphotransferase (TPT1/KptA family)
MLDTALRQGLNAPKNDYIHLHKNKENALSVKKNKEHVILLKIDMKQMYEDGIIIFETQEHNYLVSNISNKYIKREQ